MILHQLSNILAKTDCPKKRAIIWELVDSTIGHPNYFLWVSKIKSRSFSTK